MHRSCKTAKELRNAHWWETEENKWKQIHVSFATDGDLAQISFVGVHDTSPGDRSWVNVHGPVGETPHFLVVQRIAVSLRDSQFHQTLEEKWGKMVMNNMNISSFQKLLVPHKVL